MEDYTETYLHRERNKNRKICLEQLHFHTKESNSSKSKDSFVQQAEDG
jgi:hypothetical protein